MRDTNRFPEIPKALMDELEKRFPDRMPDAHLSVDVIRIRQGETNVIRFMKNHFEKQNQTVLEKK